MTKHQYLRKLCTKALSALYHEQEHVRYQIHEAYRRGCITTQEYRAKHDELTIVHGRLGKPPQPVINEPPFHGSIHQWRQRRKALVTNSQRAN